MLAGNIIYRQRGPRFAPASNVASEKTTPFAKVDGIVGSEKGRDKKQVSVYPAAQA